MVAVENLLITVEHFSHIVHEFKGAVVLSLLQLVVNHFQAHLRLLSVRNLGYERALEGRSCRIFSKLL
jgi:hypothetical protein